jgi:MoxR-like ATPase
LSPEHTGPDDVQAASPDEIRGSLAAHGYLADAGLSTVVYLALRLGRPLFLEGEPGAGKTELARVLASMSGGELIRLQCYEGIDVSQAVYEWDYSRQLLHLRAAELRGSAAGLEAAEDELYSERFLVRRPLLRALLSPGDGPRPVLLIDEVDRADDEFEAYLLEMLSDYAVTVPEIGTFRAEVRPIVVLTSNRTRDVHDALKRRSLYHWVQHPDFEREVAIVTLRAPEVDLSTARQVTAVVQGMRSMALYKPPGVAETIDWAQSLVALGRGELDEETLSLTIGSVLKYREDVERVLSSDLAELIARSAARA